MRNGVEAAGVTLENPGRAIARRLAAGTATSRATPAGTPCPEGVTVNLTANALMSDDDIGELADLIGRKLRLMRGDDDGPAGALVPA